MWMLFAASVLAQSSLQSLTSIVGTWSLVQATAVTIQGRKIAAPFGKNPKGILTYAADGRMTALISHGERRRLSTQDRIAAPTEEKAEAFATYFSYGRHYTLAGDKVIHHVEIASVENWVNTNLVREFKLEVIDLRCEPRLFWLGGSRKKLS